MGYLRFSLALAVIHGHLVQFAYFWQERVAVFGFYLISGFLITRVAADVYGSTLKGRGYFALNRFLRIYPTYLACAAVALFCIQFAPLETAQHPNMRMPKSFDGWLDQFSVFGLASFTDVRKGARIMPPAWSLGVELYYYVIIGLVVAHYKKLGLFLFILSVIGLGYAYYSDVRHFLMYRTVAGPAAIFLLGSLCYHYRNLLSFKPLQHTWLLLIIANLCVYGPDLFGYTKPYVWRMPYIHCISLVLAFIMVQLYFISKQRRTSKLEHFLADISYPAFLLHFPVTAYARSLLDMPNFSGYDVFWVGLFSSILVSSVIVLLVDYPVKWLRNIVRNRAKQYHSGAMT